MRDIDLSMLGAFVLDEDVVTWRTAGGEDDALALTLHHARRAYRLADETVITAFRSPGNGGKPVLVLQSTKLAATRPAHVHTHYHGNGGTVAEAPGDEGGFTSRLLAALERDPQTVHILPECANPPALYSEQSAWFDCDWSNAKNPKDTVQEALAAAGIRLVGHETLALHSRGYRVAIQAIERRVLVCDRLELLDCLYGGVELRLAEWAETEDGKRCSQVAYVQATNEAGKVEALHQAFGPRLVHCSMPETLEGHRAARTFFLSRISGSVAG
jgi:hypothetical protein